MTDSHRNSSVQLPRGILGILPAAITLGILTGLMTNAINGWLSPLYFKTQFSHWRGQSNWQVWALSLGQGALEGAVNGLGIGLILMFGLGIISKLQCPFPWALRIQVRIIAVSLIFGCVFGINALLLASFFPQFYDFFLGLPPGLSQKLRFAWVSGFIIGLPVGGLFGTVQNLLNFASQWNAETKHSPQ